MAKLKATQDATSKSENYKIFTGCLDVCTQKLFALNMSSDINKLKIIMSFIEHTVDLFAASEKGWLQEKNKPELVNIKIEKGDLEGMSNTDIEENIPILEKQYFVPRFTEQNIVPRVSEQNIRPQVEKQNIIPRVAEQNIRPQFAKQNMIPRVAKQNMRAQFATQKTKPRVAEQNLRPRVAEKNIKPRYTNQNVESRDSRFDKSPIKALIADDYQNITPQATNQMNIPSPNNGNYPKLNKTMTRIEANYDSHRTSYGIYVDYNETGTQQQYLQYIPPQQQQYIPLQQQQFVLPQQQQYVSPQQQQYVPPQQQQLQQLDMYNIQPIKMKTMPYRQAPGPSWYYPH